MVKLDRMNENKYSFVEVVIKSQNFRDKEAFCDVNGKFFGSFFFFKWKFELKRKKYTMDLDYDLVHEIIAYRSVNYKH